MKNIDVAIRAYQATTDLEALSAIWFEASMLAHPFIGETRLREQRALIETVYLPKAETWVALTDDKPAGFISLLDNFIGGLFVSPSRQDLGIGRALVAHAKTLKGDLELEVYLDNHQACTFYQALGFEEVSRRSHDDQRLPFGNAHLILRA